jgi:hypothetical protein
LAGSRDLDPQVGRAIRGGPGVRFLVAFADALGLPVTGAVHAQEPDPGWRFEGPTITASPGGSLSLSIPADDNTFGAGLQGDYIVPT